MRTEIKKLRLPKESKSLNISMERIIYIRIVI
jgi:hypothetical protein